MSYVMIEISKSMAILDQVKNVMNINEIFILHWTAS